MQPPQTAARPPRSTRRGTRLATLAIGALVLLPACGNSVDGNVEAVILSSTVATTTLPTTTTTLAPVTTPAPLATTPPPATTVATTVPPETTTTVAAGPAVGVKYANPAPIEATPTLPANANAKGSQTLIGTIRIPKLNVNMGLYEGVTMPVLDLGPGHWPGTAWPGQVGNVVIGGHRTSHHKVFRRVDELKAGDQILVDDSNGTHTYAVSRIQVIDPSETWIINPTETATITLFACHPPGSTKQRIVVFGDLVS